MIDLSTSEYPCLLDIIVAFNLILASQPKGSEADIEELAYDAISCWDEYYENDEDWFSEEDTDMKDSLRDQFLEWYELNQV